jgi:hypothetical protein
MDFSHLHLQMVYLLVLLLLLAVLLLLLHQQQLLLPCRGSDAEVCCRALLTE